jgi:hypothetical protein
LYVVATNSANRMFAKRPILAGFVRCWAPISLNRFFMRFFALCRRLCGSAPHSHAPPGRCAEEQNARVAERMYGVMPLMPCTLAAELQGMVT